MPAARRKPLDEMPSLLDITAKLRSGACVPALREAVKSWKAGGRKGITDTTGILLNYWFDSRSQTRNRAPLQYYDSQREAIETLIYVWEVEKVRTRKDLLERYAQNIKELHSHLRRIRPLLHEDGNRQRQNESHVASSRMAILQRSAASRKTSRKTTPKPFCSSRPM